MSAGAGDLELLDHPVAQRLLSSTEPAQLAYSWLDGTPRTIPIWFHQLRGQPIARIRVAPQWANVIDFETRFPSALST